MFAIFEDDLFLAPDAASETRAFYGSQAQDQAQDQNQEGTSSARGHAQARVLQEACIASKRAPFNPKRALDPGAVKVPYPTGKTHSTRDETS